MVDENRTPNADGRDEDAPGPAENAPGEDDDRNDGSVAFDELKEAHEGLDERTDASDGFDPLADDDVVPYVEGELHAPERGEPDPIEGDEDSPPEPAETGTRDGAEVAARETDTAERGDVASHEEGDADAHDGDGDERGDTARREEDEAGAHRDGPDESGDAASLEADDADAREADPHEGGRTAPTAPGLDSVGTADSPRLSDERRAQLRRAGRIGLTVLVVLAVLPFIAFAAPQVAGADHSFVVLSGSMEPAISTGDVVLVTGTDPAAVQEGDVITFQRSEGEKPTTHRVVEIEGSGGDRQFRTKGDANDVRDRAPVDADQYIGRVSLTIPFIGHVISFVNSPIGFGLFVVLPITAFVLSEAWEFYRRRSDDGAPASGSTGRHTSASRSAGQHAAADSHVSPARGESSPADPDATPAHLGHDTEARPANAEARPADGEARPADGEAGAGNPSDAAAPAVEPGAVASDSGGSGLRSGAAAGRSTSGTGRAPSNPTGGEGRHGAGAESAAVLELTGTDLTLSAVVLGLFAGYAGWTVYASYVAFGAPRVPSVVVFTGTATAFALVVAARYRLGEADGRPAASAGQPAGSIERNGQSPSPDDSVHAPTDRRSDPAPSAVAGNGSNVLVNEVAESNAGRSESSGDRRTADTAAGHPTKPAETRRIASGGEADER